MYLLHGAIRIVCYYLLHLSLVFGALRALLYLAMVSSCARVSYLRLTDRYIAQQQLTSRHKKLRFATRTVLQSILVQYKYGPAPIGSRQLYSKAYTTSHLYNIYCLDFYLTYSGSQCTNQPILLRLLLQVCLPHLNNTEAMQQSAEAEKCRRRHIERSAHNRHNSIIVYLVIH